jgi:hypothetical protein
MGIITIFSNPGLGSNIGEDTVALLESIEHTFDVRLPEEGPVPATVGKLCELVISCLPANRTTKCVSTMTFYSLRRAMIHVLGARRNQLFQPQISPACCRMGDGASGDGRLWRRNSR